MGCGGGCFSAGRCAGWHAAQVLGGGGAVLAKSGRKVSKAEAFQSLVNVIKHMCVYIHIHIHVCIYTYIYTCLTHTFTHI